MNLDSVRKSLSLAKEKGLILSSTYDNVVTWLDPNIFEAWVLESIAELAEKEQWEELNDRFYKTLAFGTGGLRGRTIGKVITRAEQGKKAAGECPEHTAVGSNCMNDFNVRRAAMGMTAYIQETVAKNRKPHIVLAHDPRHFSRHFAELASRAIIERGGIASLFESERSTPELSFAVRALKADAGVVITASHNPPHDNGFKAYFNDGAQVIEPHASGIIKKVQAVTLKEMCQEGKTSNNQIQVVGKEIDEAYAERVKALVLEKEALKKTSLKVVYSSLHGTGVKMVPKLLQDMGCTLSLVSEQMVPDGRFSTVKSPNPENAEALTLSVKLAEKEGADIVMATDPDADRMGVAIRTPEGKMELLSGNQTGSLIAFYRLEKLFAQKILTSENRGRACLIKTVVTTDLQKAIAQKFQIEIPETLTGFKYIGEKLQKYEKILLKAANMDSESYRALSEDKKRDLLLKHSHYYVFGGEESYGYSAADFTRDKDANAACVMFAELAAFAKSNGKTVQEYLDGIYAELGYYKEKLGQLVYEGADGARKIQNILRSYEKNPPAEMNGVKVVKVENYGKQDIKDVEGDLLPKELLLFVELANGARYAVRGSGTEPKIKFYLFAHEKPMPGSVFGSEQLAGAKKKIVDFIESLWTSIQKDAEKRTEA